GAPGAAPVMLGHEDFSFDPRTLLIRTEAGAAHTGLSFDNRGRKYVSDLARPLQAVMFPARYLARNSFFPKPPELTDVINPTDVVFRLDRKSTRLNSSH